MRVPGLLLLLLVLGAAASARAQGAPELGRARQMLHNPFEPTVRQGADLCAQADDVAGARLLLEVLRRTERVGPMLAPAHYRDIVWDALVRLTDPYARALVERELRENLRNAGVRQWCAELLGIYGDQQFAPALIEALRDPDSGVRRWAARSLGMLRYEPAEKQLARLASSPDPFLRANVLEALVRIDAARHKRALLAAVLADEDGGVRCALLGAVGELFPGEVVPASAQALADRDWRPRLRAVANLARVRTKASVDALVRAAGDERPLVAYHAVQALRRMTGKEILEAESWRRWWESARDTFQFPEREGEFVREDGSVRTVAYGIPLVSDHVAFVLDKSARMADRLEEAKTSKDKAAHKELKRVLGLMRGRLTFNVYLYRETVKAFRDAPVACELGDMHRALRFVAAQKPKGAKDIWQVLETVVSDPEIDTVYLLSSGEPDVGEYVHWNRVTRYLADLNRFHMVTVHTIVYSERQWYRDQLEKIAEATGGRFKAYR